MKFSSLQENLKQSLFVVSHVAGKNLNLPILNNVMIEAKDGNIKLTTTNLEVGVSSVVRGKIEVEGSFTVDSKILSDYIALLPNQKINLEQKDSGLIVECENYKTKINGQTAEEFPLIPTLDRSNNYRAEAADLKNALAQVIFAASTSEARIELSGILFSFNEDGLTLAATDSYRLAEKKIKIKNNQPDDQKNKKIIIPAKTAQELFRILSGSREEMGSEKDVVEIYNSENQILFVAGTTEIVSKLIEGQYPDYTQIIPTTSKTSAQVEINKLARAVKASALFSKTGINDINLDFPQNKKQLIISSASGLTGENITEIETVINGEDNGVVVNYRYLLDGLNNINGETVKIDVVDGNTPCILRPEKDNDYLYIIMPIKQ